MLSFKSFLGAICIVAFSNSYASEIITVTTGVDTGTVLLKPGGGQQTGPFASAFVSADFTSADGGANAVTISTVNQPGGWVNSLTVNPAAQWIGDLDGATGQSTTLYSFPFNVTEPTVNSAFITVYYAVDDFFGDLNSVTATNGPNSSVYINGTSVGAVEGNNFLQQYVTARIDVTALVNSGANRLYLLATNATSINPSNPGGIMAHAVIEINNDQAVPTLSEWSIILLSLLLLSFGFVRVKYKN